MAGINPGLPWVAGDSPPWQWKPLGSQTGANMELFRQAATIMVLGMGLVFVFLGFVILCVQVAARVIQRHAPGTGEDDARPGAEAVTGGALVAALAVAIHERETGAKGAG